MPTFKLGDRVRIRQWDDMAKQFGLDEHGDIQTRYFFTKGMRELCGQEFTITRINDDSLRVYGADTGYTITTDMIEHAVDTPVRPGMLIRGLRYDDDISTVLRVNDDGTLWCANAECPSGVTQWITEDAAVRYSWESEWRTVNKPKPKHEPARGDVYRHKEGGSLHMVSRKPDGLFLVCVEEHHDDAALLGAMWSYQSLFGGADDEFEYVGHASDILKVEV